MTEQGTQAWRDERSGHVTASRISDVMAKPRKGQKSSTTRDNYRAQLVCEILSGKPADDEFMSWDMKRGIELEPAARIEYELKTGYDIETAGFTLHPKLQRAGCSPDALIGPDGLAQFKCPKSATHISWLMAGLVPTEHRPQMYFEMACTGRQWSDFVSYDPNLSGHELFIARLRRDDVEIADIEMEVVRFNAEVDEIVAKLSGVESPLESQLKKSLELVQARKTGA